MNGFLVVVVQARSVLEHSGGVAGNESALVVRVPLEHLLRRLEALLPVLAKRKRGPGPAHELLAREGHHGLVRGGNRPSLGHLDGHHGRVQRLRLRLEKVRHLLRVVERPVPELVAHALDVRPLLDLRRRKRLLVRLVEVVRHPVGQPRAHREAELCLPLIDLTAHGQGLPVVSLPRKFGPRHHGRNQVHVEVGASPVLWLKKDRGVVAEVLANRELVSQLAHRSKEGVGCASDPVALGGGARARHAAFLGIGDEFLDRRGGHDFF